jgi:hypothetical protein
MFSEFSQVCLTSCYNGDIIGKSWNVDIFSIHFDSFDPLFFYFLYRFSLVHIEVLARGYILVGPGYVQWFAQVDHYLYK